MCFPGQQSLLAGNCTMMPETTMHAPPLWNVDQMKILTRTELATVLADAKGTRSANGRRNLIILRLAACCGLRVSEIAGLTLADVIVDGRRPHLRLPKAITKGHVARVVPLWWDAGTLADLAAWKAERLQQGARPNDPFVCSVQAHRNGQPLQRAAIRRRFLSACKVLGRERCRALTIHHGRHTFISHALAGGRSLAEVRAAAGHSNVSVTSAYLHIVVDDTEPVGNLFHFPPAM
jgi:integrase/recombinase XerD